jgi:hypothetical protein
MMVIPFFLGLIAVCSLAIALVLFVAAFVTAIRLRSHVAPPHKASDLFFRGYLLFRRDTFLPTGEGLWAVLLGTTCGALLSLLLGGVAAGGVYAMFWRPPRPASTVPVPVPAPSR